MKVIKWPCEQTFASFGPCEPRADVSPQTFRFNACFTPCSQIESAWTAFKPDHFTLLSYDLIDQYAFIPNDPVKYGR